MLSRILWKAGCDVRVVEFVMAGCFGSGAFLSHSFQPSAQIISSSTWHCYRLA